MRKREGEEREAKRRKRAELLANQYGEQPTVGPGTPAQPVEYELCDRRVPHHVRLPQHLKVARDGGLGKIEHGLQVGQRELGAALKALLGIDRPSQPRFASAAASNWARSTCWPLPVGSRLRTTR